MQSPLVAIPSRQLTGRVCALAFALITVLSLLIVSAPTASAQEPVNLPQRDRRPDREVPVQIVRYSESEQLYRYQRLPTQQRQSRELVDVPAIPLVLVRPVYPVQPQHTVQQEPLVWRNR